MGVKDLNNELENISTYKVKKCLKCGTETDVKDKEELFCSECGAPVVNTCSNYHCQEFLSEKAKFCKYCGSTSVFYNYGLLGTSIHLSPNKNEDDLPF